MKRRVQAQLTHSPLLCLVRHIHAYGKWKVVKTDSLSNMLQTDKSELKQQQQQKNEKKKRAHVYLSISMPLRALLACTHSCLFLRLPSNLVRHQSVSVIFCFIYCSVYIFFSVNDFFAICSLYFSPYSKMFYNFHCTLVFERLAS